MTPKQQVERIESFRSGEGNVLIATSVGEEGLDIPTADLVIFYEPVASEIRTIQRRGRTGRQRDGDVVVLIAEDTRDEGARAAAIRREQNMHRAVARVSRKLARSTHVDLSNLSNFSVVEDGSKIPATEFVIAVRKKNRPVLKDVEEITDKTNPLTRGNFHPLHSDQEVKLDLNNSTQLRIWINHQLLRF